MKFVKELFTSEFKTKGLLPISAIGGIAIVVLIKIMEIKNIKPSDSFWSLLADITILWSWFGFLRWLDYRISKKNNK